jgi:hypothetical protein
MNTLKAKTTIYCETCGCPMKRTKSIKVKSGIKDEAIEEAKKATDAWKNSLKGQNCKICKSKGAAHPTRGESRHSMSTPECPKCAGHKTEISKTIKLANNRIAYHCKNCGTNWMRLTREDIPK